MFDLIGLFLIIIFTPIIIANGVKHYSISVNKTLKVLALILLGLELFRFFYTANFYEKAYMPANEVTFSFISFSVVIGMFATFNKRKFGDVCKKIIILTSLAPVVIALFYPHVYTNELDVHSVVKGLYFAEVGILTTISYLLMKEEANKLNAKSLWISISFVLVYIFTNLMRNILWISNMKFNFTWFLCMGLIIVLVFVCFWGKALFTKKSKIRR